MSILFGTAGTPADFHEQGHTSTLQILGFLERYGLDCFEYQCGHGVHISTPTAAALGEKARAHGIVLSLHTPYYISLSSQNEETREKSIGHILQSARAAHDMGATRMVIHSGSAGKMPREQALALACDTLRRALDALDAHGYDGLILCPETMGKINQLGTAQEVMELCKLDERLIPTLDFGHLNARTFGGLKTVSDYERVLEDFVDTLGFERMKRFHCHFSRIEWSAGGEKRHLTFDDDTFGPFHEPFLEAVYKGGFTPCVISESAGTQARDAKIMKDYYQSLCSGG